MTWVGSLDVSPPPGLERSIATLRNALVFAFLLALLCLLPAGVHAEQPAGVQAFLRIRQVFRSHRPPPPFEIYTIERAQLTVDGAPDLEWSYTYRVWCRNADRAALGRRTFRGRAGRLEFMRPAFNEARDPGPPTADLFEPAPIHPQSIAVVPSPEPLPLIGDVFSAARPEYDVLSMETRDGVVHLRVKPRRDPDRNRLRELWADEQTYELRKVVATDKLFIEAGPVFDQLDTITMKAVDGIPVIADIHTRANFDSGAFGDGLDVDYHFRDIVFPISLPDWYFEPAHYGQYASQAPL